MNPNQRLIAFILGITFAAVILEVGVRRNLHLFEAASHRALTKVALFEMHPEAKFLFLGTSRIQDGVSPDLITRELLSIAPQLGRIEGFNCAFTGSSLDALLALIPKFSSKTNLQIIAIELSEPQIINESVPWEENKSTPANIDDFLGEQVRKIAFVRFRKAFLTDNLGRLPALLLFGPALSGWETKGSQQISSWFGRKEPQATDFKSKLWIPKVFSSISEKKWLAQNDYIIAKKLSDVSLLYRRNHIKVIFIVPPIAISNKIAPERIELQSLFSEVSRLGDCPVLDFTSSEIPDGFFRDPGHLNQQGRAHFSRALAIQFLDYLKGQ